MLTTEYLEGVLANLVRNKQAEKEGRNWSMVQFIGAQIHLTKTLIADSRLDDNRNQEPSFE